MSSVVHVYYMRAVMVHPICAMRDYDVLLGCNSSIVWTKHHD